jgi:UDP-glucose 4-epimerase
LEVGLKVLVSGGAGYIGSHTAHQLCDAGHDVVVLDNLYSGHEWAVPAKAQFVKGDIGDRAFVEGVLKKHGFDAVIHFAAHIEVGESVADPAKYYRNNTASALTFFDACAKEGVRSIVFSSTAAVYGEPAKIVLKESDPLQPASPYGASKMMTERILADLAAASGGKLHYVILRYFNVAGARIDGRIGQATPRATHLIKLAAQTALGLRGEMAIFGTDYPTPDGTGLRDYIHVEDLAQAHLDALAYLDRGGRSDVFNAGYGHAYSVREVIDTMKRVSGVDFKVLETERRAGDVSALIADNTKIRQTLGWTPRYDNLTLICETALNWEKLYLAREGR